MNFNIFMAPLIFVMFPLAWVITIAWNNRRNPTTRAFMWFTICVFLWVLSYALELASTSFEGISFWLKFEYVFFQGGVLLWLIFVFNYVNLERHLTRGRIVLLTIIPIITLAHVLTNDQHHLFWSRTDTIEAYGVIFFDRDYGPVFWLWSVYSYFLGGVGILLLLRRSIFGQTLYRGQALWLSIGVSFVVIASLLTIFRLVPVPQLDLTPYGAALLCIPVGVALFRYRLLDLMPAAYAAVFQHMSDAVIICDGRRRIVDVNPAARQVWASSGLKLGMPAEDLLPSALFASQTSPETSGELTLNDRIYTVRRSSLLSDAHESGGCVLVMHDVTALKAVQQQKLELALEREHMDMLHALVTGATHDIATPLTMITTSLFLLERTLQTVANANQDTAVQPELTRALGRVNDLVSVTATLKGVTTQISEALQTYNLGSLQAHPVNLNTLVESAVQPYQSIADAKGITLTSDLHPELPPIALAEPHFRRALNKLIDNALTFTASGGSVCVRTSRENGSLLCEVRDTGIGISAQTLPHIFDDFFRGDESRPMTGSSGLGLGIAQRIIESHGGEITVESTPLLGSTFRICLPLTCDSLPVL